MVDEAYKNKYSCQFVIILEINITNEKTENMNLLTKYVDYNLWANKRIIDILSKEADELIEQEIVSSFPSIKMTLLHIWGAEYIWLSRLNGNSPKEFPSLDLNANTTELYKGFLEVSTAFLNFVQSKDIDFLISTIEYSNLAGQTFNTPANEIIQHCMNHSTFHRGQIITFCRQLGINKLKPTDFIAYSRTT